MKLEKSGINRKWTEYWTYHKKHKNQKKLYANHLHFIIPFSSLLGCAYVRFTSLFIILVFLMFAFHCWITSNTEVLDRILAAPLHKLLHLAIVPVFTNFWLALKIPLLLLARFFPFLIHECLQLRPFHIRVLSCKLLPFLFMKDKEALEPLFGSALARFPWFIFVIVIVKLLKMALLVARLLIRDF